MCLQLYSESVAIIIIIYSTCADSIIQLSVLNKAHINFSHDTSALVIEFKLDHDNAIFCRDRSCIIYYNYNIIMYNIISTEESMCEMRLNTVGQYSIAHVVTCRALGMA